MIARRIHSGAESLTLDPVHHLVPPPHSARAVARGVFALGVVALVASAFAPWQQTVSGRGTVVAFAPLERRQDVEAPIAGRVVHFHVQEGTHVEEGDPIVTISDNDPHLLDRFAAERQALETRLLSYRSRADLLRERVDSVRSAQDAALAASRARVDVTEERVRSAQEAVTAATASLTAASAQLERQQRLGEEGLVSQRDLELTDLALARARTDRASAQAALGAAEGELAGARAALAQAESDKAARIQESQATYDSAETDFAGAQAAIQRLDITIARSQNQTVRAPRAGTILRLLVRQGGEQVSAGDKLVTLVPEGNSRAVELWIDGNDAPLVTRGRKVRIQFEGWPAVQFVGWPQVAVGTFGGTVALVDSADDGAGSFRVVVVPDRRDRRWPPVGYLRQGVRAKGFILLERVRLGFEIWRRFNGFPPSVSRPPYDTGPSAPRYGGSSGSGSGGSSYGGAP